jgi:hypothetical protein
MGGLPPFRGSRVLGLVLAGVFLSGAGRWLLYSTLSRGYDILRRETLRTADYRISGR